MASSAAGYQHPASTPGCPGRGDPLGPEVDGFEAELAIATGRGHGVALSSGTAALHLALVNAGLGTGDRVAVQSLTFAASANAVKYVGAEPVFIDSEEASWNMDPDLLAEALQAAQDEGRPIAAVMTVDIYGQCADYDRIVPLCETYGAVLIEDAAEALGARYAGKPAGSFGHAAALSFNGNKIITTSGGGALVTDDEDWAARSRFLATQARDPAPHYQHSELGYNYRLSNILAAMGRAQLADLEGLRFVNDATLRSLFAVPVDLERPAGVEVNRLNDQRLVSYYAEEWSRAN